MLESWVDTALAWVDGFFRNVVTWACSAGLLAVAGSRRSLRILVFAVLFSIITSWRMLTTAGTVVQYTVGALATVGSVALAFMGPH